MLLSIFSAKLLLLLFENSIDFILIAIIYSVLSRKFLSFLILSRLTFSNCLLIDMFSSTLTQLSCIGGVEASDINYAQNTLAISTSTCGSPATQYCTPDNQCSNTCNATCPQTSMKQLLKAATAGIVRNYYFKL